MTYTGKNGEIENTPTHSDTIHYKIQACDEFIANSSNTRVCYNDLVYFCVSRIIS